MKINSNGTLSLPAMTITTHQLDQLLQDLAKARSQMQPAVPDVFAPSPDERPLTQSSPAIRLARAGGGEVGLCLRHGGFGWLVFLLDPSEARSLSTGLMSAAGPGNFSSEDVPGGDLH